MQCIRCEIGQNAWPVPPEPGTGQDLPWDKRGGLTNNAGTIGPTDARVLVLGGVVDLEGHNDVAALVAIQQEMEPPQPRPFSNRQRTMVGALMRQAGLDPTAALFTVAVRCSLPEKTAPCPRHIEMCVRTHLLRVLARMPNLEVVVAMGPVAHLAMRMVDAIQRGVEVPETDATPRGHDWQAGAGFWVVPTYELGYLDVRRDADVPFRSDLTKAAWVLQGGPANRVPIHYTEVRTPEAAEALFRDLRAAGHFVYDSETTTISWPEDDDHILCLQFSWAEGQGVYLPLWENEAAAYPWDVEAARKGRKFASPIPDEALVDKGDLKNYWEVHYGPEAWARIHAGLKDVFEDDRITKTGHNIMYDARMLWAMLGIECRNYKTDTMTAHAFLVQDAPHDLKTLANDYTDLGAYDDDLSRCFRMYVKNRVDQLNKRREREYNARKATAKDAAWRRANPAWAEEDERFTKAHAAWVKVRSDIEKKYALAVRKNLGLRGKEHPYNFERKRSKDTDEQDHASFWAGIDALSEGQIPEEPVRTEVPVADEAVVEAIFQEMFTEAPPKPLVAHYGMLPLFDILVPYACKDVDATIRLENILRPQLEDHGLMWLFTVNTMTLLPALVETEVQGISMDIPRIQETHAALMRQRDASVKKLNSRLGEMGKTLQNAGSSAQLTALLIDDLKLPVLKRSQKTKKPSLDADVMKAYRSRADVRKRADWGSIEAILNCLDEIRMANQLDSHFAGGLLDLVQKDGRLHPSFVISRDEDGKGTATGRLSSRKPNCQNIPRDDPDNPVEIAKTIRQQFITHLYPSGRGVLVEYDLEQAEVRVAVSVSDDKKGKELFANHVDIHSYVARLVPGFNLSHIPEDRLDLIKSNKVYKAFRSKAKAVLFGTMYGQSAFGMSKNPELKVTEDEAQAIIDTIFEALPEFAAWIERTHTFVEKHGYVVTPWGRVRWIRDGLAKQDTDEGRQAVRRAHRQAVNSIVQAHASDYATLAFAAIWLNLRGAFRGLESPFKASDGICKATGKAFVARPILMVHDSVMVSAPVEEAEEVAAIMQYCMSIDLPTYDVPMLCDGGITDRWSGRAVDAYATYREREAGRIGKEDFVYYPETVDPNKTLTARLAGDIPKDGIVEKPKKSEAVAAAVQEPVAAPEPENAVELTEAEKAEALKIEADPETALALRALAKWANVPFRPTTYPGQEPRLGDYVVRTRPDHTQHMRLTAKDPDDQRFAFVTGTDGRYRVRGYTTGKDGKLERRKTGGQNGATVYAVAAGELRLFTPETLPKVTGLRRDRPGLAGPLQRAKVMF